MQVYLAVKADPWVLIWAPTSQHNSALDLAVDQWRKSNAARSNEVCRNAYISSKPPRHMCG